MIYIHCGNGLGNRLLGLTSALYLSRKTNKEFIINWPIENCCRCNFSDLFSNDYNVTNYNFKVLIENIIPSDSLLILRKKQGLNEFNIKTKHRKNILCIRKNHNKNQMLKLFESENNILYRTIGLPHGVNLSELVPIFNDLKISDNVLSMIKDYDTSDMIGFHIRGTDAIFGPNISLNDLENRVRSQPQKKYFVCSDQKNIEDRFGSYNNVCIFKKTHYTEKIDATMGWKAKCSSELGPNSNINRGREATIQAFCDMLLLSKTKKIVNISKSTFSQMAKLLKSIRSMAICKHNIKPESLYERYTKLCLIKSDINEHLPVLYDFAGKCETIVEFGVRSGVSTFSLLAAKPRHLYSYDIIRNPKVSEIEIMARNENVNFSFTKTDVLKTTIPMTDLLFIDTRHTYKQLTMELKLHSGRVSKYIILHDTVTFGYRDEGVSVRPKNQTIVKRGLIQAINDFLNENNMWVILKQLDNCNGLIVLNRI